VEVAPGSCLYQRVANTNKDDKISCTQARWARWEGGCLPLRSGFRVANRVPATDQVIYQIGNGSMEDNMKLALLAHIINEPAFNMLRTQARARSSEGRPPAHPHTDRAGATGLPGVVTPGLRQQRRPAALHGASRPMECARWRRAHLAHSTHGTARVQQIQSADYSADFIDVRVEAFMRHVAESLLPGARAFASADLQLPSELTSTTRCAGLSQEELRRHVLAVQEEYATAPKSMGDQHGYEIARTAVSLAGEHAPAPARTQSVHARDPAGPVQLGLPPRGAWVWC
jgi:hypothetical protein